MGLFKKEIAKEIDNQCYDIKESSYNFLAITVKMEKLKIVDFL